MTELLWTALAAPIKYYELYKFARIALIVLISLCSIAAIVCVCMQTANSEGIDSITGSSETFYSNNNGRSKESVLKIITAVCLICIAVFSIGFYLLELLA